jgi:phosphoribosylformylglycinamidine synthase
VAIAEMAMGSGIGGCISLPSRVDPIPFLFGEDQGRYVLSAPAETADSLLTRAKEAGIAAVFLGTTGDDTIAVTNAGAVTVAALRRAHEGWLPAYMSADELPPTN